MSEDVGLNPEFTFPSIESDAAEQCTGLARE